jgi:hypothetical protein
MMDDLTPGNLLLAAFLFLSGLGKEFSAEPKRHAATTEHRGTYNSIGLALDQRPQSWKNSFWGTFDGARRKA